LTDYYLTANYKVYPIAAKVVDAQGQVLNIRAKTFQLLLLLLLVAAKGQTVSKQHILEHIWDDVLVDVQVIFQSIKERMGKLRQHTKHYGQATLHFQQALEYHQVLRCPLGQANRLQNLSVVAHAQGDLQGAKEIAQQALTLIQERDLLSIEDDAYAYAWQKNLEHSSALLAQ
jgi:tetratricopeptide (TPR) repeat protein